MNNNRSIGSSPSLSFSDITCANLPDTNNFSNHELYSKSFRTYTQHNKTTKRTFALLLNPTSDSMFHSQGRLVEGLMFIDFSKLFPIDLTLKVFKKLNIKDIRNTMLVNSSFNYYSNHHVVWKNLCIQHINKKCCKCGWGLPPLFDQYLERSFAKKLDLLSRSKNTILTNDELEKRFKLELQISLYWKEIYHERHLTENNWRSGLFHNRSIKISKSSTSLQINCLNTYKNIIVLGGDDSKIRLFDMSKECMEIQVLSGHLTSVNCVMMDNFKIVSGDDSGNVNFWCVKESISLPKGSVTHKRSIQTKQGSVLSLCFQSQILATGGTNGDIKIWDCQTENSNSICVVEIKIHQDMIVANYTDGIIRIYNLNTKRCITEVYDADGENFTCFKMCFPRTFTAKHLIECMGDSSMKKNFENISTFITGSTDRKIKIWGFRGCTKKTIAHLNQITCLDSDLLRIVTGSSEKCIKVWDARSLRCNQTFFGLHGTIKSVKITDTRIIAVCDMGYLYVWDCQNIK